MLLYKKAKYTDVKRRKKLNDNTKTNIGLWKDFYNNCYVVITFIINI